MGVPGARVREFFAFMRAARAPLLVSVLLAIALVFPPQVIEVYRSVAQSLAIHFSDFGQRLRELGLTVAALILVSAILWLAVRYATSKGERPAATSYFDPASVSSAIIAVLPIIAISVGCLWALTDPPTAEVREAARVALVDIVAAGSPREPPAELVNTYVTRLLNYNWYIGLGALGGVVLAALLGAAFILLGRWFVGRKRIANARVRMLLLMLLCSTAILALCLMPASTAVQTGPIGELCIFAAIVAVILSIVSYWSDRMGVPFVGFVVIYVCVISVLGLNDNHRVFSLPLPSVNEEAQVVIPTVEAMFARWLNARPDLAAFEGRRYPVYIIAAQGGGIYAAYHTASSLGAIQDSCPSFARHTFAISGVSGGSVGAAVFAALAKSATPATTLKAGSAACHLEERPRREWSQEFSFTRVSDRILSQDYLTPVIYGLLFPDFVQLFVPRAIAASNRARQFEQLLEKSMADFLATEETKGRIPPTPANLLARPFVEHWRPEGDVPALVLNTTEVGSGLRRAISPFTFGGDDIEFLPVWQGDLRGMPLSTAAILSARFPWITPPGWYYERRKPAPPQAGDARPTSAQLRNQLVDGAYFEHSGVASALDVIRTIKSNKSLADKIDLNLIILTRGDYSNETFFGIELLAPVQAMLNARAARGYTAIRQAERELAVPGNPAGRPSVQKINLVNMGYPPPLGWRLSKITGFLIEAQNGRRSQCALGQNFTQTKPGRFDADCAIEAIHRDFSEGSPAGGNSR